MSIEIIEAAGLSVIFKNETVYIETKNERFEFGYLDSCGQYFSKFSPNLFEKIFELFTGINLLKFSRTSF